MTGLLLAAIYAAAQSTLSTGLNSVSSSWTLDIQERLSKKPLSFETQTKIGRWVSLIVGIFSIVVAMILANGGVKSAYEWFNGFMGLVLGILIGTFILGAFTKVANTFGAVLAFIAASGVMFYIKYFVPAENVSIWSYSIISIAVSLVVGIPASIIWRKVKGIYEQYPRVLAVFDTEKEWNLTKEEGKDLIEVLGLKNKLTDMEMQTVYFRGCYDGVGYLKKAGIL